VFTPFRLRVCEPLVESKFTPLLRRQVAKVERAWLKWALAAVLERRAGAVVEAAGVRAVVTEVVAWGEVGVVAPATRACDDGSGAGGAEAPPEAPQAVRAREAADRSTSARAAHPLRGHPRFALAAVTDGAVGRRHTGAQDATVMDLPTRWIVVQGGGGDKSRARKTVAPWAGSPKP